jgi:hypothetical protein
MLLDEMILNIGDKRYVGHVWADPRPAPLGRGLSLHCRFSSHGQYLGEFPALLTGIGPGDADGSCRKSFALV